MPMIILAIVVLAAIAAGVWYYFSTRDLESTDDAFTDGNVVVIAPRVAGNVVQLDVTDNQFVHKGDLLLKLDPRTYQAERDNADGQLALAKAQLASAQTDLEVAQIRAPAQLRQAQAQLATAQANRRQAELDYRRQHSVDPRATTQTTIDNATAQLATQTANVHSAEAQVAIASLVQQTIDQAREAVSQRQAQVEQAQAQLDQAEANLTYTQLRAPADGWVTRRNVQFGNLMQAGQTAFQLVTTERWVIANFKENQLDRMRVGQKVDIELDAFPDLTMSGHIDSVQQGTGSRFSAFPAENATGNYVKIVQRVPVKILIDKGLPTNLPLPLGLSVVPTVHLAPSGSQSLHIDQSNGQP